MPDHEATAILDLQAVSVDASDDRQLSLTEADLTLREGEAALLQLPGRIHRVVLGDLATGVIGPAGGRVLFEGVDWRQRSHDELLSARGRIGRVFSGCNWIANLNFQENLTLSQLHLTQRSTEAIEADVRELADRFGLPDLDLGRPHELTVLDRLRGACVRAFLGEPRLVILERPADDAYPLVRSALHRSIEQVRLRGGAVLWITANPEVASDRSLAVDVRARLVNHRIELLQATN